MKREKQADRGWFRPAAIRGERLFRPTIWIDGGHLPSKQGCSQSTAARISLARARDFDFDSAKFAVDDSQDYGEERWIALGFLDATLHVLVFTELPVAIHAISLRKAKSSERKEYAQN